MKVVDPNGSPPGAAKWSDATLVGILLLVTLVCYGNILINGFVYDDGNQILENPYVKNWHFLPQIFGSTVWSFVGQAGTTNYYRPLMTFSFLVLWHLFGPLPFGFHLFSLAVHAAVVLLVFFCGRRLFTDWRVGWTSALLFAVHPIHTEAVDWIAALPDVEATFFCLIALYLLADPARLGAKRNTIVAVSFGLALLSKEPAFMFAPLAILYVHAISPDHDHTSFRQKFTRYVPLGALAVAYLLVRTLLFGKLAPVLQRPTLGWSSTIDSAFAMILDYARMLTWPGPLSVFHVFHPHTSFFAPPVLAGVLVVLSLCASFVALYRRHAPAAFSLALAALTLAPVLNARWMAGSAVAERYLYLPSVGFCWFAGWCCVRLWNRASLASARTSPSRLALVVLGCLLLVAASARTVVRNFVWRSDFILYTETLKTDPDAHNIRANLATTYFNSGALPEAEAQWDLVLAKKPDSVETMINLGRLYTRQHRYPAAAEILDRAIAARPLQADAHYTKAQLLQKLGESRAATTEFQRAVELSPLSPFTHYLYADQLAAQNRLPEAQTQFTESIRLGPSLVAFQGLARLYLKLGQPSEAEQLLRRALVDSPHDGSSHLALARILELQGLPAEARKEYEEVLQTDPDSVEAHEGWVRLGGK